MLYCDTVLVLFWTPSLLRLHTGERHWKLESSFCGAHRRSFQRSHGDSVVLCTVKPFLLNGKAAWTASRLFEASPSRPTPRPIFVWGGRDAIEQAGWSTRATLRDMEDV